jgi:hypothetical protein
MFGMSHIRASGKLWIVWNEMKKKKKEKNRICFYHSAFAFAFALISRPCLADRPYFLTSISASIERIVRASSLCIANPSYIEIPSRIKHLRWHSSRNSNFHDPGSICRSPIMAPPNYYQLSARTFISLPEISHVPLKCKQNHRADATKWHWWSCI